MSNALLVIVAFGAMIFFHELGHFLVAKRAGVRIHAFALGFGPQVFGWKRGETTYALNVLPVGGYVRMEGEDSEGEGGPGSFRSKSVGARIAIIAAGPAMNLLLAVTIFAIAASTGGVPTGTSMRVASIERGWPAAEADLRPGDAIVAIDATNVESGDQVIDIIHRSAGRQLALTVRRGTEDLIIKVTPRFDPQQGFGRIGYTAERVWTRLSPPQALVWGIERTGQFTAGLPATIASLIREGIFFKNVGGPVAAGVILAQAAAAGVQAFLHVAASVSIIIGIFNLLPIPALDGGRLAFLIGEAVRRRPLLDTRREGLVHLVGFALLMILMFLLTYRDIKPYLSRLGQ